MPEPIASTSYYLTPTNLDAEREKFSCTKNYNPQFVYPPLPLELLKEKLDQLSQVSNSDTTEAENIILQRKIKEKSLKIQLLLNRGKPEFNLIINELYPCNFDKSVIELAQKDSLLKQVFHKQENLTLSEIVNKIQNYLHSYQIFDWHIESTSQTEFYFRIQPKYRKIIISQTQNWDFCDLDNMLAHEIDCHVLRSVNAEHQTNLIFQKPLPFYLKTEEGLACYLGDCFSITSELSRKHHALKYLAGQVAKNNSFINTYNFLINNGFTPDLAFQRTFRLKKGLEDTSQPGLFTKEAMYYEGMIEVKNYFDSSGDIKKLFSGKFGLGDLKYAPVLSNALLPHRFQI